jgi:CSLREA domain-containing protein
MSYRLLPLVPVSLLVLAACGEDRSPTGPMPPSSPSDEAVAAAAGQRVVNSLADPGDGTCDARQCTLREALDASGTTAVTFASGLTGPITLAAPAAGGGTLDIARSLTVTAPSAGVTIRRRSSDPEFRILRVAEGVTVTLTNLAFRNGRTRLEGGGIINRGTLTLVNCTVAGNASTARAGGIHNLGPLTLRNTTVADNEGTGIRNIEVRLVATGSLIARNSGFGIVNERGGLALTNTTFLENRGVGIADGQNWATGSTLDRVKILGNSAGGYYINNGHSTITRSTIARNSARDGAGIHVSYGGTVHVVQSTITGNSASGAGGGIFTQDDPFGRNGADIDLVNSTVTGNSAETGGGIAIDNNSEGFRVSLTSTTLTSNSARVEGGGILGPGYDGPSVSLRNSIVALNTAPSGPDLLGEFSASFNLIGNATGSDVTNADGNKLGLDPKLGSLSLNGGPTRTIPLLAGSPAIDAGTSDRCPADDQRGVSRPQGAACDMGSYEREAP